MKYSLIFMIVVAAVFSGCGGLGSENSPIATSNVRKPEASAASAEINAEPPADAGGRVKSPILGSEADRKLCFETDTGDNVVYESQTFAIDFEPFRGSCFVTSHNPENDDPPLESEYAIFREGRKAFDLPEQFNGVTTGCWVEAVAFEDLNDDGLVDIVVIGKCSAKTAPYNENMVYANNGKGFDTNPAANVKASELSSAKAVIGMVKENREMFFK